MSNNYIVSGIEDLPCNDWKGTDQEEKDCPMLKWQEGEQVICFNCGYTIVYDSERE